MPSPDHFTVDPDWEVFASQHGYPYASGIPQSTEPIQPLDMDVTAARNGQALTDAEWAAAHPLEAVGYVARLSTIKVRDGTDISVRISHPSPSRLRAKDAKALPVLFVTHGGGWIQGSHLSEEAWLLYPLYAHFDLVVISVEYRLAPEHRFPVWIEDSWDVLQAVFSPAGTAFADLEVEMDRKRVLLAGSSSGAGISAVLSQMCRDVGMPLAGVILNVPVLCDYRHFPAEFASAEGQLSSYAQCVETYSSGAMVWVWNTLHPNLPSGTDPQASPLLGNCERLPRHLVFVTGQDALRDEGIAYAAKLDEAGLQVELEVYGGVPHNFAHYEELKATSRFRENLRAALEGWLRT